MPAYRLLPKLALQTAVNINVTRVRFFIDKVGINKILSEFINTRCQRDRNNQSLIYTDRNVFIHLHIFQLNIRSALRPAAASYSYI